MNNYKVYNPETNFESRLWANELIQWADELSGSQPTENQAVELLENRGYVVDLVY